MGNRAPVHRKNRNCPIYLQGTCPKNSARLPNNGIQHCDNSVICCDNFVQEAERLQGISKFPIYYTYSWSHVYAAACVIMNHEVDGEER